MPNKNVDSQQKTMLSNQETVMFHNDALTAIKDGDGEIWAVINEILRNIGFDETKVDNQRKAWAKDIVISKGSKILPTLTNGGLQPTSCINRRYIPIALAKISITPTMQRDHPMIVDKLISYQEECADVLYAHFMNKKANTPDIPISREELSLFLMETTQLLHSHISWVEKRDRERDKILTSMIEAIKSSPDKARYNNAILKSHANDEKKVIDQRERINWLNKVWTNIYKVSERSKLSTLQIFEWIYKLMNDDPEANFKQRCIEYKRHTGKSKIVMCSEDEQLRRLFVNNLLMIIKYYFPEKYSENNDLPQHYPSCLSKEMISVPKSVKNLIDKYAAHHNISYTKAQCILYKELERNLKIKLKDESKTYAATYNYSKCSNGYYISAVPEVMRAFRKIARIK